MAQAELEMQVRETSASTTKEAKGLRPWDLALAVTFGQAGPMGGPSVPKSLGRIPQRGVSRAPVPKGSLIRMHLFSPTC